MNIEIFIADYNNSDQRRDIPRLLDIYAQDPMGGSEPLRDSVKANLVDALAALPHGFVVLAYCDQQPAGLAICFEAFSTFQCKPIVNIHDLVVVPQFRGRGIARQLLAKVETEARARGCCKLTLEVLSNNEVAKAAYLKFGFAGYQLDPAAGQALFWEKKLAT